MNHETLTGIYAERIWSWDWLGTPIGLHGLIRPSDMDGWVHQCGEMLILEGKVTRSRRPELSRPQCNAVDDMGNVTGLLLHTDEAHWHEHRPTRLLGYLVRPSVAFPWQSRSYLRLPSAMSDEDTLRTVINVVVVWTTWAATRLKENP